MSRSCTYDSKSAGGYNPAIFVQTLHRKHICNECDRVLHNAVQTEPCGHRFCESCIKVDLRFGAPLCPANGCTDAITAVYPDNFCRRQVLDLVVRCRLRSAGCTWEHCLKSLENHNANCYFALVLYENSHGHATVAHRRDLRNQIMEKYQHSLHKGSRVEITAADGQEQEKSTSLVSTSTVLCLPQAKGSLSVPSKPALVHNQQGETRELHKISRGFQEQAAELCIKHGNVSANSSSAHHLLDDMQTGAVAHDTDLSSSLAMAAALQSLQAGKFHAAPPDHHFSSERELINRVTFLTADATRHFVHPKTKSRNGFLDWKINDVARRLREARYSRKQSLNSPPFYTSRYGHKMCARVYLNGDGAGENTHMSLFSILSHGEYDNHFLRLFPQKVTMMLLDRSPDQQHISETFLPDKSLMFSKGSKSMKIASGCPQFVSLKRMLKSSGYVKEDTIYIRITMQTAGYVDY